MTEQRRAQNRRYYERHKERIQDKSLQYHRDNRERVLIRFAKYQASGRRDEVQWRSRGLILSKQEYDDALQSQGGKCLGCEATVADSSGRKLHADHDHKTGIFRGLLCTSCNAKDVLAVA